MSKILVTGGKGQLACCIKRESEHSENTFIFLDKEALDVSDGDAVNAFFAKERPDFCVNCAGYTDVDKAESEARKAKLINVEAPRNLARACKHHESKLIHISTDFVFDGLKKKPYTERDSTNPLGVYGQTKLAGEKAISDNMETFVILRTSWLYSTYGQNFMTTMMRLGKEKDTVRVVDDQMGTPTYATDLARFIMILINKNTDKYGTYHYSNEGVATWYDFALAIFKYAEIQCDIIPVATSEYPAVAERPSYSVLDKGRVQEVFGIQIPKWRDSLKICMAGLKVP